MYILPIWSGQLPSSNTFKCFRYHCNFQHTPTNITCFRTKLKPGWNHSLPSVMGQRVKLHLHQQLAFPNILRLTYVLIPCARVGARVEAHEIYAFYCTAKPINAKLNMLARVWQHFLLTFSKCFPFISLFYVFIYIMIGCAFSREIKFLQNYDDKKFCRIQNAA